VQNLRPIDTIAECDVLEVDMAADRGKRRAPWIVRRLGGRVEDVSQPRNRKACLVKILPHLRQAQHRSADTTCQYVEGDELAYAKAPVNDKLCAEIEDNRRD
jgi:hypothetical protein